MILADFHIHTNWSDGQLALSEVIDYYGGRGFGAIAITDHICEEKTFLGHTARFLGRTLTKETFPFYLKEIEEQKQRAWDQYRMVVLPGFELSKNSLSNHRSAHILGLGVTDYICADGDILDLLRGIRSQGAVTVAAHPVSTRKVEPQTYHLWDRRRELAQEFDAWEVASGPHLFDEVLRSGLPMLANSDLHHPRQITAWKTLVNSERHPEAILDAIRNQRLEFTFYEEKSHTEPFLAIPSPQRLSLQA